MSFQIWTGGGNLTADPDMKYVGETPKTSFSIAINKKIKDKEKTIFVDVECWGPVAETVAEYKRKGDYVVVIGEWEMDEWEDNDGKKRRKWFVRAQSVKFEGNKPREEDDRPRRSRDDDRPRRRDRDDDRPRRSRDEEPRSRDSNYDDLPF